MDPLSLLRFVAAALTILAAIMVAANWSAQITRWGFVVFIAASIAWTLDGWLEGKASLVIQNLVLLFVNIAGVWRYSKATDEA